MSAIDVHAIAGNAHDRFSAKRADSVDDGIQLHMDSPARLLRRLNDATKLLPADAAAALTHRWDELPPHVRTPAQLLGRRGTGCEGTHGVFPQCNFGCRPCYHSTDANRVRIDGPHTVNAVDGQMRLAHSQRGPTAYAQLIGGEVTLLTPDDHAAALTAMRAHGRVPMSFSHGDFDYDYLEALVFDKQGCLRFKQLAFAVHIDSTMHGRRAIAHPTSEAQLDGERARVMAMFDRLRREHGVSSYIAHNMTITPDNVDDVPGVISRNRHLGYRMFSFQPAAYIGNEGRWQPGYRGFGDDDVWARIADGAGTQLPYRGLQFGDLRCNRVTWGAYVGDRFVPLLDENDERDLHARDHFLAAFPGLLGQSSKLQRIVRVGHAVATHPRVVIELPGWATRFLRRSGGLRAWRHPIRPTTFVMHRFIDAADTAAAWVHLEAGTTPTNDRLIATTERLQACAYSMAHPDTGRMIPACVQHAVFDPIENAQLVELLPRKSPKGQPVTTLRATGP